MFVYKQREEFSFLPFYFLEPSTDPHPFWKFFPWPLPFWESTFWNRSAQTFLKYVRLLPFPILPVWFFGSFLVIQFPVFKVLSYYIYNKGSKKICQALFENIP